MPIKISYCPHCKQETEHMYLEIKQVADGHSFKKCIKCGKKTVINRREAQHEI
jgi:NAD-dependent SIR2 family protein deacetylase